MFISRLPLKSFPSISSIDKYTSSFYSLSFDKNQVCIIDGTNDLFDKSCELQSKEAAQHTTKSAVHDAAIKEHGTSYFALSYQGVGEFLVSLPLANSYFLVK